MPRVTISYRREDSGVITGRIFDRLVGHYGRDSVFRDIDNIPIGVDFRAHIEHVFDETDIVLAIVGPHWIGPAPDNNRMANPADPVRIEIEGALRRGARLIPVLVLGARMPTIADLPESMHDFAYRNAVSIDAGQDFDVHMARLTRGIDDIFGQTGPTPQASAKSPNPTSPAAPRTPRWAMIGGAAVVMIVGIAIGAFRFGGGDRTPAPPPQIAAAPPANLPEKTAPPSPASTAGSAQAKLE